MGGVPVIGKVHRALRFSSSQFYVEVPDAPELDLGVLAGQFSIDAWVKPADVKGRHFIPNRSINLIQWPGRGYALYVTSPRHPEQRTPSVQVDGATALQCPDGSEHCTARVGRMDSCRSHCEDWLDELRPQDVCRRCPGGRPNRGTAGRGERRQQSTSVGSAGLAPQSTRVWRHRQSDETEIFNRVLKPEDIAAIFDAGGAGKYKHRNINALSPADVWLGLKTSDDVGTKFDLRAEEC